MQPTRPPDAGCWIHPPTSQTQRHEDTKAARPPKAGRPQITQIDSDLIAIDRQGGGSMDPSDCIRLMFVSTKSGRWVLQGPWPRRFGCISRSTRARGAQAMHVSAEARRRGNAEGAWPSLMNSPRSDLRIRRQSCLGVTFSDYGAGVASSAMTPSAMTMSTLRFLARPSRVVFSATGRSNP